MVNRKSHVLLRLIQTYIKTKNLGIVEIGVYRGENASYLLSNLVKNKYKVSYYGFNLFEDAISHNLAKTNPGVYSTTVASGKIEEMSRKIVYNTLEKITPNVVLVKGDSKITVPEMHNKIKDCNFFYIDGGHDYTSVKADWVNVSRIAKSGSIIVFDDVHAPGVRKLICEIEQDKTKLHKAYKARRYVIKV